MADTDLLYVGQGANPRKAELRDLKAYLGDSLGNVVVADQTINAATTAYLTNSNIAIPAGKLRIGSSFIWRIGMSKTAAGTASNSILVKCGTAGTTADTTVLTFTTGTGTAVADDAFVHIIVTCRGPLSSTGKFQGVYSFAHNLDITGWSTSRQLVQKGISANFDVTTANLIMGLAFTTAASTVVTFQTLLVDAKNI